MEKFYLQEIKRIESDVQKIECMLTSKENKRTALKTEQKSLIESKSSNWQEIIVIKTKIENFGKQIECLEEVANTYKKQIQNYQNRIEEEEKTEKFRKLKLN